MAGQEAHVYKYADRSQLFYQCQISITIKEPNSECPRPQCAEPQGFGAQKVGAADAAAAPAAAGGAAAAAPAQLRLLKRDAGFDNTMDVRAELSALELTEQVRIHIKIYSNSILILSISRMIHYQKS